MESILTPSGAETAGRRAPHEVHWSRPAKGPAVWIDPWVHDYCSPDDQKFIGWTPDYGVQLYLWRDPRLRSPVVSLDETHPLLCPFFLPISLPVTQPCVCSPSADAENIEHTKPQEEISPNNLEARMSPGETNAEEWLSGSSLNCNAVSVAAPTAVPTTVPTTR